MTENISWEMNDDNEQLQEEPSSHHLLVALEDLLKRSHNSFTFISKIKYQSKSVDDLLIHRRHRQEKNSHISIDDDDDDINISNTTRTEFDLSGIAYDDDDNEEDNRYDLETQRSRSAPASPTKIYDKELAAFIDCDHQQQQQQSMADNFVYNIDLSDSNETSHPLNSRLAIFFEDDFSSEEINYEPSVNLLHSSLINSCLTITEENEEELEQLRRDDDEEKQRYQQHLHVTNNEHSTPIIILPNDEDQIDIIENDSLINDNELSDMNNLSLIDIDKCQDNMERLSTIYESPSPQPEIDDNTSDKLVVYDIANLDTSTKVNQINSSMIHPLPESIISPSLSYRSPMVDHHRLGSCYTDASFEPCPNFTNTLTASRLCGTTTMVTSKSYHPSSLSTSLITTNNDENSSSSPVINTQFNPVSFSPKPQTSSQSSPVLYVKDRTTPQHVKKMKVIQSSSSSLSDFISSTPISTLQNTSTSNGHHSLTNCSSIDENNFITNQILDDNHERRPSYTRRIITNGLLFSHCASNPISRRIQEPLDSVQPKSQEKCLSDSSSSSELLSSSDEKLLTRSEFLYQDEQNISQQRKAFSLKSISMTSPHSLSKILYPIDFETNHIDISWHQKRSSPSHKVPTSDSGIVIDKQLTSKSSIEEDDTDQLNYREILIDLTIIKKNIVDIESRLNEAMRELEIEQALIEGEHELVFKQILDASESDQQKIRQLHQNLQILIERIMTEKNSLRNEIDYTQQNLFKFEQELYELEHEYRRSDEKILKKKEILAATRKKYEDLEFQLMEFETRCESELEQAEEHFQNEQKLVTQNAKFRQNTLRELDHQQYMVLHEATIEKEKLEREKQKLKLFFKQKKLEANELEQKIHDPWSMISGTNRTIYQSTPISLYSTSNYTDSISSSQIRKKDDHQEKLNEIKEMMAKVKLEKMTILEQQLRERYNENIKRVELEQKISDQIHNQDYQVKLREKNRTQERPLTRYLPIRSVDFNLRAHIEGAGHQLDTPHISLTSTTCRGYLHKMGGIKFKTWNRRWFIFDRQHRSLFYYQDKNETKLRGCISFQSILEVYIDHLQSISLRSPEPREATFIVKTIERSYYLVAPTVESMRIWIDVIITGAEGNIFARN